jgi:ABC-type phosphate/phosphonate transport system substrate-binding protein
MLPAIPRTDVKETNMASIPATLRRFTRGHAPRVFALMAVLSVPIAVAAGRSAKVDVLRVGTSRALTAERNEKNSLDTLKSFIKDETGLDNEIIRQKDWHELADKMSKGQLEVGVFQGYEFAWAREKYPDLKPLAVAVNIYVYPVTYVVVRKDEPVKDFAGLQGRSVVMTSEGPGCIRLFTERQCEAAGKKLDSFFSKVSHKDNFEDVIDDVFDSVADAGVVDRAALEAYKRRKPGRFAQLKPVAQSQPFPPSVVAYYGTYLSDEDRTRFRDGLLNAANKDKGQTMLTLFRLTGFQAPPADFSKVLAETRAAYPPDSPTK